MSTLFSTGAQQSRDSGDEADDAWPGADDKFIGRSLFRLIRALIHIRHASSAKAPPYRYLGQQRAACLFNRGFTIQPDRDCLERRYART